MSNMDKRQQKIKLLEERYEMACHNLMCYSENYLMNTPKEKFKDEWEYANEECQLLKEMIEDYAS